MRVAPSDLSTYTWHHDFRLVWFYFHCCESIPASVVVREVLCMQAPYRLRRRTIAYWHLSTRKTCHSNVPLGHPTPHGQLATHIQQQGHGGNSPTGGRAQLPPSESVWADQGAYVAHIGD